VYRSVQSSTDSVHSVKPCISGNLSVGSVTLCQDWFFTDLISTRGLGVRGWSSGKTEMLRSVVTLPE